MLGNAFNYDNGIVHHDPDREHDGEKREKVDAETHHRHRGECPNDRDRYSRRRNQSSSPVLQEYNNDN